MPGTPCIYYGTELAMEGSYDPDCRRCFDWDESNWDKRFLNKPDCYIHKPNDFFASLTCEANEILELANYSQACFMK